MVFQRPDFTGLLTGDSIASGTSDTCAPVSGSKSPSKAVVLPNSTENLVGAFEYVLVFMFSSACTRHSIQWQCDSVEAEVS